MHSTAVINASPLIFLSRSGHLDLLHRFYPRILVPAPVFQELMARGESDPTVTAVRTSPWLELHETERLPDNVLAWGLGAGESAVLALALQFPGSEAILDDLLGRRCATSLGIPVRGTLGLILLAKQKGVVSSARPIINDLLRGGMFLERRIIDNALRRVGE